MAYGSFGPGTITAFGGAVGDLLGGEAKGDQLRLEATASRLRASGNRAEAENYDLASGLSGQNLEFTKVSTAIKEMQMDRQVYKGVGTTRADIAGAGFAMSGSALDIMAEGASQGALNKAVLGQQGLITEAGYKEQQQSYNNMSVAARYAASVQDNMASRQDDLADDAETTGAITGGIKAAAGFASLFM